MARLRIFFSWQNDLDQTVTTRAIRAALREAATHIEDKFDVEIETVEATSNSPGAPYVPYEIADKIKSSSIFVGDITPVVTQANGKKCPNPNVTFELGIAASQLGWGRIIMLLNTQFSDLKELPFDFDRHRISNFSVRPDSNRKTDITGLKALLVDALSAIVGSAPKTPRELEGFSEDETKRTRDIRNIIWFLREMNTGFLDQHIKQMPDYLDVESIFVADGLAGVCESSDFRLYDSDIELEMRAIQRSLSDTLRFDKFYRDTANWRRQAFGSVHCKPRLDDEEDAAYESIKAARDKLSEHLRRFLDILHERYVEIDVDETNRQCARAFKDAHKELFKE
jgi:hypothetical protein